MYYPALFNIVIYTRSSFDLTVIFKDSQDTPIDLTGYRVIAQLWNKAREVKHADFQVTIENPVDGSAYFYLSPDTTATLLENGNYDVKLIEPSGREWFYLAGKFTLQRGYSDE